MIIWQILAFLLLLAVVVTVHELGHYLFARWRKMDVEEFCIFGLLPVKPKIVLFRTKAGMDVTIRPAVPLGGFVRIKGMEPKPDGSEVTVPNGFYSRGLASRALVLFAGPLFSVLGGFVIFALSIGILGEIIPRKDAVIGEVIPGLPAQVAGLRAGDRVLSIGGKQIKTFADLRLATQDAAGKPLRFEVQRSDGTVATLVVSPTLSKEKLPVMGQSGEALREESGMPVLRKIGQIGVKPVLVTKRHNPLHAAMIGLERTGLILAGTIGVLIRPAHLKENVGGPISIARFTGEAAEQGVRPFLALMAVISISLGIFNLLPIWPMDGGQLVIVGIEALRGGRRLALKTQEAIATVGVVLVVLIILSVFYLDIRRLKEPSTVTPVPVRPTLELSR